MRQDELNPFVDAGPEVACTDDLPYNERVWRHYQTLGIFGRSQSLLTETSGIQRKRLFYIPLIYLLCL